jgi:thioredoxin reductase (NADPH)
MEMKPSIIWVCGDEETSAVIEDQLRQRYSIDYEVTCFVGIDAAGAKASEEAALVLVDAMWDGAVELLAAIKESHPSTRRLAIAPWGQAIASETLQGLMQSGLADYFAFVPQVFPDEQFHLTISELLEEWGRDNSASFEFVRMVDDGSAKGHYLKDLLQRNDVAHGCYTSSSAIGSRLLAEQGLNSNQLPLFALYDGRILVDPDVRQLADAITGQPEQLTSLMDVVIVGAGPSGLAAAVYGASEGLTVAVLEREAIGGQAGTTSMIRNYLGFHRGITGQQLASRAFRQAWSFGARVRFIREATAISSVPEGFLLTVSDGTVLRGRSVVLAQGVTYRRLGIKDLEALVGAGVYYGAAVTEAPSTRDSKVFVVGGGNSAGQAAIHLSKFASHVTLLVRGDSLAASMSEYLITEMQLAPNISIDFDCQIVDGGGDTSLEWIAIKELGSGMIRRAEAHALFVLIGAVPATDWLPPELAKDQWGFILTGSESQGSPLWQLDREPHPFETSLPGVFAVGDVRRGSVKRVASAAGEGSAAIQSCHAYLSGDVQAERTSV